VSSIPLVNQQAISTARSLIIALLLIGIVIASAYAKPMPEDVKKAFIDSGVQTCMAALRKNPQTQYLRRTEWNEYCYCKMKTASDFISVEELGHLEQTKDLAPTIPVMETASHLCLEKLRKQGERSK